MACQAEKILIAQQLTEIEMLKELIRTRDVQLSELRAGIAKLRAEMLAACDDPEPSYELMHQRISRALQEKHP